MRTRWLTSLNIAKPSWICLLLPPAAVKGAADGELRALGLAALPDAAHAYALRSTENWSHPWQDIAECLKRNRLENGTQVAIINAEARPTLAEASLYLRSVADTQAVSEQMWLIDVIEQGRLTCYFQPVIDRRGEVFGWESLVRAIGADGDLISGGAIFQASKLLRIEHLIDRHLHELAIQCFVEQKLSGFLFINLVPGFIQRPEFYFGGLGEAARHYGMNAKHIVLDCTNSENPRDMEQLKAITAYCRSQGYLVSLDDIESPQTASRILKLMQPDFIKIDMRLVRRAEQPEAMRTIRDLVELTRHSSCALIAEGVETEEIRSLLEAADIGLYQGYLFSPPPETRTKPKSRRSQHGG